MFFSNSIKNRTSFDYSWTEYFSILLDQLGTWREVLSIMAEDEKKIMPHMEVHLERVSDRWWKELITKIDTILATPHPEMKNSIIKQLDIFKAQIDNYLIKKDKSK